MLANEEYKQTDKDGMRDIVSSPSKGSSKLNVKLGRVSSSEMDQSTELPDGADEGSNQDVGLVSNSQCSRIAQDPSVRLCAGEQVGCQQVPVLQNTKKAGAANGLVYDDGEMEVLAEIERVERESASERERCSKEVQDKGEFLCVCVCTVLSSFLAIGLIC